MVARTCDWNLGGVRCDRETQTAVAGRPLCMDHGHHLRAILALREARDLVQEIMDRATLPNGLGKKAKSYVGKTSYLLESMPTWESLALKTT